MAAAPNHMTISRRIAVPIVIGPAANSWTTRRWVRRIPGVWPVRVQKNGK